MIGELSGTILNLLWNPSMANKPATQKQTSQIVHQEALYHSGPLPLPEILAKYDAIVPGAANRIIVMAENQSTHRIAIEKLAVSSRARDSIAGIVCALIVSVVTISVGGLVIIHGYQFSGTFLSSSGLASLVGAFIYGTRSSREEREKKMQGK